MKFFWILLLLPAFSIAQNFTPQEVSRYKSTAKKVTIIRDKWGIPHIYAKADADVVFGLMYAQAEENFPRMERNYLEVFGRLAEIDGEQRLYSDLQMQLIYDSAAAKKDYANSPEWFKKILNGFADGINYYLHLHPDVKPAVLKKFEPWYALMLTNGSISATQTGGATLQDTRNLYAPKDGQSTSMIDVPFDKMVELKGSNGFAVAPSKTASGNSILYINPHVTFYFRSEVQMVSKEGLNAYGAVTWGNFFVYQGFNEHCGWMHTSSYADVADLYEEKIVSKDGKIFYEYEGILKPITSKQLQLRYKKGNDIVTVPFTAYYTHHGPVMGSRDGKWLSLKENNRSLNALMQSWLRTKAKGLEDFKKVMEMRSNSSDNTVFADNKGNIAYWHGNFIPVRDEKYNWSLPLDGTTSATEWKGLHTIDQTVHLYNPASGWIQNCNSTPFTVSGESSPKKEAYPEYMAPDGQNPRAINAIKLLSNADDITIDKMIQIGYDNYLAAFDVLLPSLFKAYDELPPSDGMKQKLKEPVALLKRWDKYSSTTSIPATLAIEWAYKLTAKAPRSQAFEQPSDLMARLKRMTTLADKEKLELLSEVINDLQTKYGSWQIAWGDNNRYQRNGGFVEDRFDDNKPSLPVGLASSAWGSLPAFEGRNFPGVKKRYGVSGNSFVASVEFGKKVKAKSVITGGQSFDPKSKHLTDQASLYIEGKFKDVLFYKKDVLRNLEKKYHPGEK